MPFEIEEAQCKLTHLNTRTEHHGEESVLACDLTFSHDTTNDVLGIFAPSLKSCLYARDDDQPDLLDGHGGDHLTKLRFPQMGAIKWDGGEIVGGTLTFTYGVRNTKIEFDDVKVGGFKIEPKHGGTVTVHFRAQLVPPKEHRARLMELAELGTVTVTIAAPEAD